MKIKNIKPAKDRIKESYIKLLKEKPIDKITVTELVKNAEINRTTFYDNYQSIDELMNEAIDELSFDMLSASMKDINLDVGINKASIIMNRILIIIKDNQKLFKIINNKRSPLTAFDKYLNNNYFKKEDNLFKAYFFRAGTDAIIKKWINEGCSEPIDDLSKQMLDLLHRVFDN